MLSRERYQELYNLYGVFHPSYPDTLEQWFNLGENLELLGENEDAFLCFEKALDLKPEDEKIRTRYERARERLETLRSGLAKYEKRVAEEPDNAYNWYLYEKYLDALGHTGEADEARKRVLTLDRDFYTRFQDVEVPSDTQILLMRIGQLPDSKVMYRYEHWHWDYYWGGSVIFLGRDLIGRSEEEYMDMCWRACGLPKDTPVNTNYRQYVEEQAEGKEQKFVFFNFPFPDPDDDGEELTAWEKWMNHEEENGKGKK